MNILFKRKGQSAKSSVIRQNSGLTALELLITLSIAAILFSLATPSFSNLISNNRMSSSLSSLEKILKLARIEALTHQGSVIICGSINDSTCSPSTTWKTGYMSFLDIKNLGRPSKTDVDQRLIMLVQEQPDNTFLHFSGPRDYIRFKSDGSALKNNGTLWICDDRGEEFAKGIFVTPIGLIRSAKDLDKDGIININDSENVYC